MKKGKIMKLNVVEKQIMKNKKKLEKHPIDVFGFKYRFNYSKFQFQDFEWLDYERNVSFNHTKVDSNKAAEEYALVGWDY